MEDLIGSGRSGLTMEWAVKLLEEKCANFQQKLKSGLTVEKIVSEQLAAENGFMSYVYKCDVHFRESDETLSYCLKEPDSKRMNSILGFDFYPILSGIHDRECEFYETFSHVEGLKIPKVYDMKRLTEDDKNGYIFMEFCGNGKCSPINLDKSLSLEQMYSIAEQIAHLHAFALKSKRSWEDRFEPVNIVGKTEAECKEVFERIVGLIRKFADDDIIAHIDKLHDVFHDNTIYEFIVFKAHLDAGVPSIISHGDLWANNVLFEVDQSTQQLTNQIGGIIDWQGTNSGNPAQDLVRIMLLNMDSDDRHKAESHVFAYYYEKLNQYLKEIGADPAPFSLEQLRNAARPYFLYQLVLAMFIAAHSFQEEEKLHERAVFVERLRHGLKDAYENIHLWKK